MTDDSPHRDVSPSRARARLAAACYATALRVVRVLAESAVAVTTLALLALVEALAGTPTVQVAGAAIPLTEAVAACVVVALARRLYALNLACDP